uniref:Uncharacterized protein n=1 Tax=Solanum lycopersicum TaxID=4081 RepID=K4C075_SOLLC
MVPKKCATSSKCDDNGSSSRRVRTSRAAYRNMIRHSKQSYVLVF